MARVLVTSRMPEESLAVLRDHEILFEHEGDRPLDRAEPCTAAIECDAMINLVMNS